MKREAGKTNPALLFARQQSPPPCPLWFQRLKFIKENSRKMNNHTAHRARTLHSCR